MGQTTDEMPPTYATGWIYVLENEYMPCLFKIGFTKNTVEQRITELSGATGVPSRFSCVFRCRVQNPAVIESMVHVALAEHNVDKEFFRVSFNIALDAIRRTIVGQRQTPQDEWSHSKYSIPPSPEPPIPSGVQKTLRAVDTPR